MAAIAPAVDTFELELDRFCATLARHGRFVLTTHVRPDGDAFGSTLALAQILEASGADVYLWHQEGDPHGFDALGEHTWNAVAPVDLHARVAVICDCGDGSRVAADLDELLAQSLTVLQMDHHASNPGFADVNVVDPDAASTCSLIAKVADRMSVKLTPEIAVPLYFGLWTDTGGFVYSNADPAAHVLRDRLAAVLGPDQHASLEAELRYEPGSYTRYAARGLEGMQEIAPGVFFTALDPGDCSACDLSPEDQKSANDTVLNALQERPARLHALWYEMADGSRHVSLRCQSLETDCSKLALSFGGGGHVAAAGFTTRATREQVAVELASRLA